MYTSDQAAGSKGNGYTPDQAPADSNTPQTEQGATADPNAGYRPEAKLKEKSKAATSSGAGKGKVLDIAQAKKKEGKGQAEALKEMKDLSEAFDASLKAPDGEIAAKLELTRVLSCLTMEGEDFSGYVLVALGKDLPMDAELISKLSSYFRSKKSRDLDGTKWVTIETEPVAFEKWAKADAEFLYKSVHEGNEIAMAFFAADDVKVDLGPSIKENLGTIDLSEIEPGSKVEFDMSIYLPLNKRFIFYLAGGATFIKEQQERLMKNGITEFHVSKSELRHVAKYRAQNALRARILMFQAQPKEKKAQ